MCCFCVYMYVLVVLGLLSMCVCVCVRYWSMFDHHLADANAYSYHSNVFKVHVILGGKVSAKLHFEWGWTRKKYRNKA